MRGGGLLKSVVDTLLGYASNPTYIPNKIILNSSSIISKFNHPSNNYSIISKFNNPYKVHKTTKEIDNIPP